MKGRIVKETYKDGTIKYRVEKHTFLLGWRTEMKYVNYYSNLVEVPVYFYTLKEAQDYCTVHFNPVISKEIIKV